MAHILLVDDDDDVRQVIYEALVQDGHRVSVAAEVARGEQMLRSGGHDMLVVDVILRGGDGFQLAELAASLGLRVLFVTGAPAHVARLATMGAPHLAKPFRLHDVVAAVGRLLDKG